jgi:hypothetical protein
MKSTKSRRHQKNLNHDPKDGNNLGNVGKVENEDHSGQERVEEGDRIEIVVGLAEIGIGEENGVDRKG